MIPFRPFPLLLTLVIFLSACRLSSAAPFECRWTSQPPLIDGRGDDAMWQAATSINSFAQPWLKEAPAPKEGTRVKLLWDREWLYFYAEMSDADVSADVFEHDGPIWENDAIELFFRPSPAHPGYFEFEVNPAGAVLDAFFPDAERWRDPKQISRGRFHLEAKVTVNGTLNVHEDHDTGWTVEGRIPWSDFNPAGGRPLPGELWLVNLARVNGRGVAGELSSMAPLREPGFHRTGEYAQLCFLGPEPLPRAHWENTRLAGTPDGPPSHGMQRAWPRLKAHSLVSLAPAPGDDFRAIS